MARERNPRTLFEPKKLACEMLTQLHQYAEGRHGLSKGSAEDEEIDLSNAKATVDTKIPTDRAAYAVRLAYCLAQHYPSLAELAETHAFVIVETAPGDDGLVLGGVLADILTSKENRVSLNPSSPYLRQDDRYVVLPEVPGWPSRSWPQTVTEAAVRRLAVFFIFAKSTRVPELLVGADLAVTLPALTPEMLALVFEASHDEVPSGIDQFENVEEVSVADLTAHVRRARPAADCLAGLRQSIAERHNLPSSSNSVQLKDLAGYGQAKEWGLELAADLELWRQDALGWDDVNHRAVVLAGPPGTGKTSFAKVLADSLRLPLVTTSVAEWNGHSNLSGTIKRMEEVFEKALAQAPCVLFIDELDGISNRASLADRYVEYWTQIINRLLELVSEAVGTEGVILVGATNYVNRIDPALLRSGRLDQVISIELPGAEAIADILSLYCGDAVARTTLVDLAPRLVGHTGADIEKLVRDARAKARRAGRRFSVEDLESQVPDPMRGLSPQTRRRIGIYRKGQRLVAQLLGLAELKIGRQHEDLIGLLMPGLANQPFPTEQLFDDALTAIMAGRAAEEIVFGDVSTFGAGTPDSDLAAATAIARGIEMTTGFGEAGVIYLEEASASQKLDPAVNKSIRRRVEAALARASALLLDNRRELEGGDALRQAPTEPNLPLLN